MNIKYFIALLEIKRGFSGNVPKGVGIRDFVILIFFISLVSILGFLFLVTYKDIPFKIEQTLLGSTNKNEIPIKYQIHYHRLDSGLDYDMVNFLKKDKRLENIKIIPEREVNLNGDIRLVGQPLKGGARLNAISLPISSPFWKKIISENNLDIDTFDLIVAIDKNKFADRMVIRNPINKTSEKQSTTNYPWNYEDYRSQVLNSSRGVSFKKEIPEFKGKIDSKKEISEFLAKLENFVFFIKSRNHVAINDDRKSETPHLFKVIWLEGFQIPNDVEMVFLLSTTELIKKNNENYENIKYKLALEGKGNPVNRVNKIVFDGDYSLTLEDFDNDKNEFEKYRSAKVKIWQELHECLLDNDKNYKLDTKNYSFLSPKPKWPNIESWNLDLVNNCTKKFGNNACDSGFSYENFQFQDEIYCERVGEIGHNFQYKQDDIGVLYSTCDTRSQYDINKAKLLVHPSIEKYSDCDDLYLEYEDPDAPLFLDGYDHFTILSNKGIAPDNLVRLLKNWTIEDAKTNGNVRTTWRSADLTKILSESDSQLSFRIDRSYSRSLVRYGVMTKIITSISLTVGFIIFLIMILMVWLKMLSMFEHRMSQYRLFSIIGMTGKDIGKIISTQVLICSSIGALLGILFGRVALYFINRIFWPAEFRLEVFKELGLNQHQLIELPPLNYLFLLFFTIVILNLFISSFVLSNLGILKAKSPSEFK